MVTLVAFLLGLILGELLGKNIPGAEYEMGPYGWRIWSAFFFISAVIGVIWEQFAKHNLSLKSRKAQLLSVVTLVSAVVLMLFVFNIIPKYPQPGYTVNSYAELIEIFSDDPQYLFPSEDMLPSKQGGYSVYLKSRFSHETTGYIMGFKPRESEFDIYTISCRLTSSSSNSTPQPNSEYSGIGLSVTDTRICFELNSCRYDIHFTGASKAFSERALLISMNIIDKSVVEK